MSLENEEGRGARKKSDLFEQEYLECQKKWWIQVSKTGNSVERERERERERE